MIKFHLTDFPVAAAPVDYQQSISEAISLLNKQKGLISIYQLGGMSAPGISDLDLLAVFENSIDCAFDLRSHLSPVAKYLFVHNCYGVSEDHFIKSRPGVFFHNCKLLSGRDLIPNEIETPGDVEIKSEIAIQFLVKMFFVMTVQRTFRIMKVRPFLLEAHALRYDLAFLKIQSGTLYDCMAEVDALRNFWFRDTFTAERVGRVFEDIYRSLKTFLEEYFSSGNLHVKKATSFSPTKNISISGGSEFSYSHEGVVLPSAPVSILGKKYFNIQSRFNRFNFTIPLKKAAQPALISYFDLVEEMRNYNKAHLPNFLPVASSLIMEPA